MAKKKTKKEPEIEEIEEMEEEFEFEELEDEIEEEEDLEEDEDEGNGFIKYKLRSEEIKSRKMTFDLKKKMEKTFENMDKNTERMTTYIKESAQHIGMAKAIFNLILEGQEIDDFIMDYIKNWISDVDNYYKRS